MTTWAVIPAKPPGAGKTRLSGPLDDAARAALVERMLAHVLETALASDPVDHVCLLGADRPGLPGGLVRLDDPGGGLNPALAHALSHAATQGASRVIVLPADLPQLAAADISLLAVAPPGTVAIAPDRHGLGTNALSLPLPAAAGFVFAFGEDSFARHRAEAERLGLTVETVHNLRLERDVDLAEDLDHAAELMRS